MSATFDDATRALLDERTFATLATAGPGGAPHASVIWVLREGDTLLFSSAGGRQKVRNIAADPRVSVTVFDAANPYHSVEIRGIAELEDDPDKKLPSRLSHKYLGGEAPPEPDEIRRVVIRVTPTKINAFSV
ncbi:PPOX class F420-dependent oxidoreductase [Amycolatopsis cynarae]|uniref:PPOX class F420-dependent oxidoreductase n=1 Tax=Amycolatopsis cynarae TaxID=2995223 RepID=A0ABY7AVZ2_9PSEU|nr:PPOX class F420-dependent oxidoreductase [Amycolatopsis sp. HUAS 11-8]WAL63208.1 PPOX class F420-dependent oxidoreductase [Amycolatopsis sp. HUAS 11-8]